MVPMIVVTTRTTTTTMMELRKATAMFDATNACT